MLDKIDNQNSANALYSKFNSSALSENKSYLAKAYGNNNNTDTVTVRYYNDENAVKKQQRKKISKYLLLFSSVVAFSSAVFYAFMSHKIDAKIIADGADKFKDKFINASTNFTNVKDDLWDRFASFLNNTPLKFIKKGGDKLTQVYKNCVRKSLETSYNASLASIRKISGGQDIAFESFDDLFNKVDGTIFETLKSNRITSGLFNGENLVDRTKNALNKFTSNNIANTRIAASNLLDDASVIIPIKEGYSPELVKALEKHNKIMTGSLIPKLRDINCGSAPTDVITSAVPIVGLLAAVANTDDKQERKSILLDLGFPIIGAVSMPFIGLKFPIINGFKALLLGFASGKVLSFFAGGIDKFIAKKNQKNTDKIDLKA